MKKLKFSEKKFHQHNKHNIRHKLIDASQTRHVDVESGLLLPPLDHFRSQNPGRGCPSSVFQNVPEGYRVQKHFWDTESYQPKEEFGEFASR